MAEAVGGRARAALLWGGLAVLVVAGFAVTVGILNATVYSAGGFVRGYVSALTDGDTAGALRLAGVQATDDPADALLGISQKGMLQQVRVTADRQAADGSRHVTITYLVKGQTNRLATRFALRRAGNHAGLFHDWQFAVAPTASLDVTPRHDTRFTADSVTVTAKAADIANRFTVLAPTALTLSHSTAYLTAPATTAVASTVGGVTDAAVATVPRLSFTAKVKADVDAYLTNTCLSQHVLLPSGCPFGEQIDDRLTNAPTWTMVSYPAVALEPTSTVGVWQVGTATGTAHLKVGAESLYDGHDYTVDENVPFDVTYQVLIGSDNGLTITQRS